ncbi:expressed unknown protein [Seminavis robusta]|uniref:Uncharacterized protein n=1 Tax=Seminavis robusta TaxID=568900 RepID=A0A9N8HXZ0_9STRA|nr:expressed unknown protein [Seminavis robusta]|eukprot:Sro3467_g348340.1 n/a (629) ;mRNA; f:2630-4600
MTRFSRKDGGNPTNGLRYVWLIMTGLLCGLTTFIVYDRLHHSYEVSQSLMVVSIETMNVVTPPQEHHMQHLQTLQQEQLEKQREVQQEREVMEEHDTAAEVAPELKPKKKKKKKQTKKKQERQEVVLKNAQSTTPPATAQSTDMIITQQQRQEEQDQHRDLVTTGPKQIQPPKLSPEDQKLKAAVVRHLEESEVSSSDHPHAHTVYFLNQTQVTQKDSFSASWIMAKKDFLDMNLDPVKMCEDAAFKAWNTRRHKLRMPLDYFDWSVEHLSKWWKVLDYDYKEAPVWDSVIGKLAQYIENGATDYPTTSDPPIFSETIATIAFQPYKAPGNPKRKQDEQHARAYNLTIVSLAATIESLRRAEMGRVVVVGSESKHYNYTMDALHYMQQHLHIPHSSPNSVGHLEVAYVSFDKASAKTKIMERNMPRACLVGARKAFLAADATTKTEEDTQHLNDWFGTTRDPSHWKYLYLTEPDSILTTRATSLPQIKEEMDLRGGIIAPMRLQPIPHESDVGEGFQYGDRYLHENEGFQVMELDHYEQQHDVCCDHYQGQDIRPGLSDFPGCGHRKWFLCGLDQKFREVQDPHERLRPYQLFRLKRGTGITTIAGNLFARRCFPGQASVCEPPHVHA